MFGGAKNISFICFFNNPRKTIPDKNMTSAIFICHVLLLLFPRNCHHSEHCKRLIYFVKANSLLTLL